VVPQQDERPPTRGRPEPDNPGLATPDEDAQIDVFNDRLVAEGHWVFAGGLAAPGTRLADLPKDRHLTE
jgi:hypothetical protein